MPCACHAPMTGGAPVYRNYKRGGGLGQHRVLEVPGVRVEASAARKGRLIALLEVSLVGVPV